MYAGLSPYDALAIYAVITYMDSVAGVSFPRGGMHSVPRALAGAVSKQLQQGGEADVRVEGLSFSLWLEGEQVADGPQFEAAEARDAAIASLREALAPQQD